MSQQNFCSTSAVHITEEWNPVTGQRRELSALWMSRSAVGAADLNRFLHIYRTLAWKYVWNSLCKYYWMFFVMSQRIAFFSPSCYVTATPCCRWHYLHKKNMLGLSDPSRCETKGLRWHGLFMTYWLYLIRGGQAVLISDWLRNVEFKQVGCAWFKSRGGHNNMNTHTRWCKPCK